MQELSKLDIALAQIERAVVLALDEADFISAVTLAGAAEEILGSLLETRGLQSSYSGLKHVLDYVHEDVKSVNLTSKEFRALANGARNNFKHLSGTEKVEVDPEQEACNLAHRAISNYTSLGYERTEIMVRWINESKLSPKYPIRGPI